MAIPALTVELAALWKMDAVQIGWLGGIYFAGYAVALPFLTGAANRMDGRIVYFAAALISAATSFGVAIFADGFWWALAFRFAAGIGFAGIHIIGMKLLVDRLSGDAQSRASAFYTAAFAIGSGCSFLVAGFLSTLFGWEAVFIFAAIGSLLALPLLALIGPPLAGNELRSNRLFPDFTSAFRDWEIIRYVIAYAGNLWEVFAVRVWFVPFLAYNLAMNEGSGLGLEPTTAVGLSVFIAVPLNLVIAELGVRWGRKPVIFVVSAASVVVCIILGWQASGLYVLVLGLLLLHGITSYGDVGAIAGGVVAASTPETRAAALALFGLIGFTFGFLGPLAVGLAIDLAGGRGEPVAWFWAFLVMALGSVVSAAAMAWKPKSKVRC
ncbi:MAG: MFS transporter [Rhodospirillaceae bacterium]|jgi:MFS family permease|nr:MFS transporter [Rhodospirillaceae bacterium]MBT6428946.1 MFS transporter [Rhodospirillaceae bacterium]MBT7758002.1 MFS transporter [Rhodospirillaceae bacterium]